MSDSKSSIQQQLVKKLGYKFDDTDAGYMCRVSDTLTIGVGDFKLSDITDQPDTGSVGFVEHFKELRDDLLCEKCDKPIQSDVYIKPDLPIWVIQFTGAAFCKACAGDLKEYKRIGTSDFYAAAPEVDPTDKKILAFIKSETAHIYYQTEDGFHRLIISDDWDVIGEMGTNTMLEYFNDLDEVARDIAETVNALKDLEKD